jgi:myo-inositol 2-dehydrogenase/D-chiro-inositol 1-dehydrogenase
MKPVKLGIIGLGRLGLEHARNIYQHIQNAALTAVCSVMPQELASASEQLTPQMVTDDYREILRNPHLDGIVIATNSQTHCEIICAAAQAGCRYVFTEKPLGMSMDEVNRIKDTLECHPGLILQVGYNHRFDPDLCAAKQKVDNGFVGDIILLRIESRDQAGMEEFIVKFSPTSGGFIADMMTHDYDTARWFTGSEAETIYGVGGVYAYMGLKQHDDMDNTAILMKFKNGTMVVLTASRNSAYGYHAPMEVFGTKGCIAIGADSYRDRLQWMNADGVNRHCSAWFYDYWRVTYRAEIQAFTDCIQQGGTPKVTMEDGYKSVEWAIKATAAVKEGKVVSMD